MAQQTYVSAPDDETKGPGNADPSEWAIYEWMPEIRQYVPILWGHKTNCDKCVAILNKRIRTKYGKR